MKRPIFHTKFNVESELLSMLTSQLKLQVTVHVLTLNGESLGQNT